MKAISAKSLLSQRLKIAQILRWIIAAYVKIRVIRIAARLIVAVIIVTTRLTRAAVSMKIVTSFARWYRMTRI